MEGKGAEEGKKIVRAEGWNVGTPVPTRIDVKIESHYSCQSLSQKNPITAVSYPAGK
jgi:hypothetical protein